MYLDRTQGVSSSQIRSDRREVSLGIIGESHITRKYEAECNYVNGLKIVAQMKNDENQDDFFDKIDAVFVVSHPSRHFDDCAKALERGKHVLCESPIALTEEDVRKLFSMADKNNLILAEGIKTAYSTAYSRLILLAKSGRIGNIVSVDSTCTSLRSLDVTDTGSLSKVWNSLTSWGPTALLPVFELLGTDWTEAQIFSRIVNKQLGFDDFSKISLLYPGAVSSSKVGKGVKSEGELVISGTKGYIYVPAPWWMTDYFEIRYENQSENRRYFYQLDGEGIRQELVSFVRMIEGTGFNPISRRISLAIARIMEQKEETIKVKSITIQD